MGREELAALIAILTEQQAKGTASLALGTWKIGFDKKHNAFTFDKCENEATAKSVRP